MSKVQVKITNASINAYWVYEFDNENCPLCHKDLMDATQEEIQKKNITSKLVVGKCNHAIHENCMNNWKKQGNNFCPIDSTTWIEKDNIDSTIIINDLVNTK
tara:strand:+ start:1154 stop:1459 length:306 start_codon:yes stop_codon:yes gene_type:complete